MEKLKIFSNFGFGFDMDVIEPCELYVDRIPKTPKNTKRLLWVIEPDEVSKMTKKIINNKDKYDKILAYDTTILESCENSTLFPYGTTWIKDFDFTKPKEFCVTSLIGAKKMSSNHHLRHQLINRVREINSIPVHLFNSSNKGIKVPNNLKTMKNKTYKNELFYSQFHIAIENTTQDNWFTEKLIDCFQTKTVPIYIGCENIGDFFDINGILHVKNLDELVDVCNRIDKSTYNSMRESIETNYKLSFKYSDHIKSLKREIKEFLNN